MCQLLLGSQYRRIVVVIIILRYSSRTGHCALFTASSQWPPQGDAISYGVTAQAVPVSTVGTDHCPRHQTVRWASLLNPSTLPLSALSNTITITKSTLICQICEQPLRITSLSTKATRTESTMRVWPHQPLPPLL